MGNASLVQRLSRVQTFISVESFLRSNVSTEEGLEHYVLHLYEDRKLIATLTLMINPPSCDDDNKLNSHLLAIRGLEGLRDRLLIISTVEKE